MKLQEFLDTLHGIESTLKTGNELIDSGYLTEFSKEVKNIEKSAAEIVNTNRNLKIGIVGGVKAGKSSFLNALIFDGEKVLPQAATPMTAALTKIVYSEKSYARVTFYDEDDWNKISYNADKFDKQLEKLKQEEIYRRQELRNQNAKGKMIDKIKEKAFGGQTEKLDETTIARLKKNVNSEYRACKELKEMATDEVLANLGQEKDIPVADVHKDLAEYVGADGKFTPIVKHIELGLANPLLKDLEIIDTPGLDDPIISRSAVTKDFLVNCDVVFLLSYCGQFLTQQDITFISNSLPAGGIRHAVLVGSKFDSALLDEQATRRGQLPLRNSVISVAGKLKKQAIAHFAVAQQNNKYGTNGVIKEMEETLPPIYISSILYDAGKKLQNGKPLDEYEALTVRNMKNRFIGFEDTADFLFDLSRINQIREKILPKYRAEKDKILEEKSTHFVSDQYLKFANLLETVQQTAQNNLDQVQNVDKEGLQRKMERISSTLNSARGEIKNTFRRAALDAGEFIRSIEHDINGERKNYRDVTVETKTEEHHHRYTTGHLWWKKHHDRVTTEEHKIVSVAEVVRQVGDYASRAQEMIDDDLIHAIDIDKIKKSVRTALLQAFNESNTEFNENDLLGPVEITMREITVPTIKVDAAKYRKMISSCCQESYVKDDEIYNLEVNIEEVLGTIDKDIETELDIKIKEIGNQLDGKAIVFIDEVKSKLQGNFEKVKKQLGDRENSIKKYEAFIEQITKAKMTLVKAGEK